jgi:hypothetical protein
LLILELTLNDKLDFLWEDFVEFIDKSIEEGTLEKEIKNNFKELSADEMSSFKNNGNNLPSIPADTEYIPSKIVLCLKDVAMLVDAGLEEFIEGDYRALTTMLKKYLEDFDVTVFNPINTSLLEMTGDHYMPYLTEQGKRAICENPEKYKDIIPLSIKNTPFYFDVNKKELSWQEDTNYNGPKLSKQEIIEMLVEYENQKIKDIALLMLSVDNLKIIGFDKYL